MSFALKNKVQLIGNVKAPPEMRAFDTGQKLARFVLATNQKFRNASGDWVTDTQWHQLVAWGKTADLAEKYLKKGSEVLIEGKLITRNYTDGKGAKKYVTEVQVGEILLLGVQK